MRALRTIIQTNNKLGLNHKSPYKIVKPTKPIQLIECRAFDLILGRKSSRFCLDSLLPSQLSTPKDETRKIMQREATLKRCKVDPTLASSETDDTDASENKTKLQLKKLKQVNKKQKREKKTPDEKVEEYECYFESVDADLTNKESIFVEGFDCSFTRDEIKSTLRKHFSSCGEVSRILIPIHCITGRPIGYGFINMKGNAKKALKLDGSSLQRQKLLVTMASKREESICLKNHKGVVNVVEMLT